MINMTSRVICVKNVNQALNEALWWLNVCGIREDSRNGPVMVAPGPVLTEYLQPRERVLFSATRDANPFFHFMEALWMLGGRNDVAWIGRFNERMKTYSDDGEALHGAYGFRWREWFAFDQLRTLVEHLRSDPNSRRAVLGMWSPNGDLVASEGVGGLSSKDLPCNTHCYLDLRGGRLNLTVLCRSNDAIWGAYGANAVHFSMLQEYLAMQLQQPVGMLRQFSHNLHVYTEVFGEQKLAQLRTECDDNYVQGGDVMPCDFLQRDEDIPSWERDLRVFLDEGRNVGYYTRFFREVATPLEFAWEAYKVDKLEEARSHAQTCAASDWRLAAVEWLDRRITKRLREAV